LLETLTASEPNAEAMVELARAWFLTGDFRARSAGERLAAYEHGSEVARRAIALAPGSDAAHLWYAINTGRWAETRGVMRALAALAVIREESQTVLRLNPANVDGLIVAGGLAADVPAFMGGDRPKAEAYFKRALEIDPHHTGARLELARLYVATKRWTEARRELQQVIEEPAPHDRPRWTASEVPRARTLLIELGDRGQPPFASAPPQSP
jgi:tetratricopeptide (TPR) repeat protein